MDKSITASEEVRAFLREQGRKGGIKGAAALHAKLTDKQRARNAKKAGKASSAKLTPEERSARAKAAAAARWGTKPSEKESDPR